MKRYLEPVSLTGPQIEALKAGAVLGDTYRFLDLDVAIRSDSHDVLGFFGKTYCHFRCDIPGNPDRTHSYFILTGSDKSHRPLLLWDDDRACSLMEGKELADSADIVVFGSILKKITSHFLVHGAVVAAGDSALIISGMSGSGKSTLALELARRGLLFGSDEIAAISRSTHLVHPFPVAIGVREHTGDLLSGIDLGRGRLHHTVRGDRKLLVDIEDVVDGGLAGVCKGQYLVMLQTDPACEEDPGRRYHSVQVALRQVDTGLVDALGSIEGVEFLDLDREGNFPSAVFRVAKRKDTQSAFLEICRQYGDSVLYRVKVVGHRPNPKQAPLLRRISKTTAALELLGNLQNMAINDGWMAPGPGLDTGQLLYGLIEVVADMDCYRLLVGELGKTADLVTELVS
jgi:hypothetical protein